MINGDPPPRHPPQEVEEKRNLNHFHPKHHQTTTLNLNHSLRRPLSDGGFTSPQVTYAAILKGNNSSVNSQASSAIKAQTFKPFSVDCATPLNGNISKHSNLVFGDFDPKIDFLLKPNMEYCGKKAILFQKSDKLRLLKRIPHVLIGKFSHGRPPMSVIKDFFCSLKLKGSYNISLFDSKHMYIECVLFEDFIRIWLEKLWLVRGFQMRVFKWSADFCPKYESPVTPVWVHLYGLPLYLFDKEALMSIANAIGSPLLISKNTLNRSNLSYASLCVELDITRPLLDEVWIEFGKEIRGPEESIEQRDGFWQRLSYGAIPSYCSNCAHIGHPLESCKLKKVKSPGASLANCSVVTVEKDSSPDQPAAENGFSDTSARETGAEPVVAAAEVGVEAEAAAGEAEAVSDLSIHSVQGILISRASNSSQIPGVCVGKNVLQQEHFELNMQAEPDGTGADEGFIEDSLGWKNIVHSIARLQGLPGVAATHQGNQGTSTQLSNTIGNGQVKDDTAGTGAAIHLEHQKSEETCAVLVEEVANEEAILAQDSPLEEGEIAEELTDLLPNLGQTAPEVQKQLTTKLQNINAAPAAVCEGGYTSACSSGTDLEEEMQTPCSPVEDHMLHSPQEHFMQTCEQVGKKAGAQECGVLAAGERGKLIQVSVTPRKLSSAAAEFIPKSAVCARNETTLYHDKNEEAKGTTLMEIGVEDEHEWEEGLWESLCKINKEKKREKKEKKKEIKKKKEGKKFVLNQTSAKEGIVPKGESFLTDEMCDIIPAFKTNSVPNSPSSRKYSYGSIDYSPTSKAVLAKYGADTSPYFGCRWLD